MESNLTVSQKVEVSSSASLLHGNVSMGNRFDPKSHCCVSGALMSMIEHTCNRRADGRITETSTISVLMQA